MGYDRHYVDAVAGSTQVASGSAVIGADGSGSYWITGLMNQVRPTELVGIGGVLAMRHSVALGSRAARGRFRLGRPSLLAGLAVAAVLAGCGSASRGTTSGSAAQPTATPASSPCGGAGACVTLTISIAGDVVASGTQMQARTSCAEVLAADKLSGQLWLVLPRPLEPVSGHQVMIYPSIFPWTGPGAYRSKAVLMTSEDGFATIDGVRYRPDVPGPSSRWQGAANVDAGGSGSVTFAGMLRDGDPTRTVSGKLDWTCRTGG
jgi:hypothetical protein